MQPQETHERRTIILVPRRVEFTCKICHQPGAGQPGTTVHHGRCRDELTRQIAKRASAKQARRRHEALLN